MAQNPRLKQYAPLALITMENKNQLTQILHSLKEEKYRSFVASLIPTISPDSILGVRIPHLRKLAKGMSKEEISHFFSALPHTYLEENLLHSILLSCATNFADTLKKIDQFLPYIDNWSVCDTLSPKVKKNEKNILFSYIEKWLKSEHTYTIRFGILMLMKHFLDDAYTPATLEMVAGMISCDYYVNMMAAWFFATALAVRYDEILP